MPIITATPVQISGNPPNTSLAQPFGGVQNHGGPFELGGKLYFVFCSDTPPSFNDTLQVYESSDNGVSWSLSATGPDTTQQAFFATVDSGSVIEIIYTDAFGNHVSYITFVPGSGFTMPVAALGGNVFMRACRFANGDFLALYSGATVNGLDFVRFIAGSGVWTTPANAFANATPDTLIWGVATDASGLANFDYTDTGGLLSRSIDLTDIVSSAVTVDPLNAGTIGPMEIWNGHLIIPASDTTTGRPIIYDGTPVGAPTWTKKFVATGAGTFPIALPIDGATLGFFWASAFGTLLNFVTYDGSMFGTPVVYYDATNIPPPGGYSPGDNFISNITVALFSGGGYGVALHLLYDDVNFYESMFYLLPPTGAGPTISGVPPDGNVGSTYTFTPVTTPGTAPDVFSIVTGTGSIPPGTVLDTTTGTISGTPDTPGTFCFTERITDSVLLFADLPICITIKTHNRSRVF